MSEADEYDKCMRRAYKAYRSGEVWTAALLYERAHELAVARGWQDKAVSALRWAADSWSDTSELDRSVKLILGAIRQAEAMGNADERYWLHSLFLWHAMSHDVIVTDLDELMEQLSELALSAWGAEGAATKSQRAQLLHKRGRWAASLEIQELAWAQRDGPGPSYWPSGTAFSASGCCLQLCRRDEAERWSALLRTLDDPMADSLFAWRAASLALYDNDSQAARATSRQVDALARPQELQEPIHATLRALYALVLDPAEGDPARPSHLIRLRLAHEDVAEPMPFWLRFDWHGALAALELAGLRHAAGMPPVDDFYYRKPQTLPHPRNARLPTEILPRLATFEQACDTAQKYAHEADTRFDCTWHQQRIADLRQRGRAIAEVFRP
ncbi:hypothetical protein OG824_01055 [Streptomyces prunicolor]|uniref:hypothetical protein n=1 Tax=Streptomyces prunicolor TaxID=67348 RepID=UPI002258E70C|nr:hypothetical protein [Streptomyces prunicolor]MCX5233825.1 hypothetical protein [Streptomyces prunicolor]